MFIEYVYIYQGMEIKKVARMERVVSIRERNNGLYRLNIRDEYNKTTLMLDCKYIKTIDKLKYGVGNE